MRSIPQGIKNWRFNQASSVMLCFKQGQPEANPVSMDDIVTLVDERYNQKLKIGEDIL